MSERDTDIEFDFFDDPETREAPSDRVQRRTGPRRPMRPPSGLTPMLRLVGLISFAILIVVLLVFVIQDCRGESKRNAYENYMEDVAEVGTQSSQIGRQLNGLLTTTGIKQADVVQRLSGLAQSQEQGVGRASELEPPGPLRPQQRHVVEALQLRVSGLRGLADAFESTADLKNAGEAGGQLADQARRLLASDVIWDDLFKDPSISELDRQGVRGVEVPDSNFLASPDIASARSMSAFWQRIRGAAVGGTTGGVHGTGLISTKVLPGGQELSTTTQNTVEASTNLAFEVTVENQGNSQEVRLRVTFEMQKTPTSTVRTATIDLINPGEERTVTFRNLGQVPFAEPTVIKVGVQPVPQEKVITNNSAEYNVVFSLGG